jgi:thymidylate synthase
LFENERLYDSAKSYFLLQRATKIISIENQLNKNERIKHLNNLFRIFKRERNYNLIIREKRDQHLDQIEESIKQLKRHFNQFKNRIDLFKKNTFELVNRLEPCHLSETLRLRNQFMDEKISKLDNEINMIKSSVLANLKEHY